VSAAEAREARSYGNWRRPKPPGLWHLGLISSVLFIVGIIATIVVMAFAGLVPGLVVLGLQIPVFLVTLKPGAEGRTPLQRLGVRSGGVWARGSGESVYRSGPLGRVPYGTHLLPGILAPSQLSEARDSYDRPFAVLCHPRVRHLTVVIETEPDGASLADQWQVDQWVAHHGHWLARLGREPGLIACQISVESAPDPGTRLRHMLDTRADPGAPAFARAVMQEIKDTYPAGAADMKARIALTYRMVAPGGRSLSATEKAHEIATRLGNLTRELHSTGAGVAVPVDAQRLCEIVHSAYSPRAAELIEHARANGQPATLRWDDIGPTTAIARQHSYWHDGAASVTWEMSDAPRGEVLETVLAGLLAPHSSIPRKRVTLLYRVIGPGEAARMVERDLHNAEFRVNTQSRPTARSVREAQAAHATAAEEARGAALINVGMLVTATVLEEDGLPAARAAIENLGPTARVNLRVAYNSQDSPCRVQQSGQRVRGRAAVRGVAARVCPHPREHPPSRMTERMRA
jgi:hypothetical protein